MTHTTQRIFPGTSREAAFLLGGIGTGNVSLGARGELRDWEISNRPGKGVNLYHTFFSIWMQEEGQKPISRVLESRLNLPYAKSHGFHSGEAAGLPRFEVSELRGEYPMAWLTLKETKLPVEVGLEAYTPMIPLNPDESGIPCAFLKYTVKNITSHRVDVTIAGSLLNALGFEGYGPFDHLKAEYFAGNTNEYREEDGFAGLYMTSKTLNTADLKYGSIALVTPAKKTSVKTYWKDEAWCDGIQEMWDDFCDDGRFEDHHGESVLGTNRPRTGSLGVFETLEAGESKDFLFVLAWHFPNRVNGWEQDCCNADCSCDITQNYYATQFKDAWGVAEYVISYRERLTQETQRFHDALFQSAYPAYVLDALASNMIVLRSTTCFRLKSGKFFGYEGCFDGAGCCEGNCTHVWNYAQTLAFLYPSLERDMRLTEFNVETDEQGKMEFRTKRLFGGCNDYHPAADGQLGSIIRLYRDWKFSGDSEFLTSVWPKAKKALEFAFTVWDSDGDYVLDSQQHNTYDIEFYGPNSLVNSMFYGALKAAAEMAEAMGDRENAERYQEAFRLGARKMDQWLWNGEYYIQSMEDVNAYKYQYGKGCLSDQLFGQLLSHIVGLGYILPEQHVKSAVQCIFKYNFRTDFLEHHNVQRTYILNDEQGLVLCSWPHEGRPKLPFIYSDEIWTGIEYQVAAHLIFEGFIDEGLTLVKAVRDRHDGFKRNPWNEVECGHHYARSMASWALLIALSGYKYDLVSGMISFNPVLNTEDFATFFSCGKAWGVFRQRLNSKTQKMECSIDVLGGSLEGITVMANGELLQV